MQIKKHIAWTGLIIIVIVVLFDIMALRHEHFDSFEDSFPGHKVTTMEAEVLEVYRDEDLNIVMLLINADGEQVRVSVQEETVIKNRAGWKVDSAKVSAGKKIKMCVGSSAYYEPTMTYLTCYEIWIK